MLRNLALVGLLILLLAPPLALVVLLVLSLLAPPGAAQVYLAPTGLVTSSSASTAATNTTAAQTLFTYTVPAGLLQGAFAPLHLRMIGQISTNPTNGAIGNVNAACSFGGTTASVMLLNSSTATPLWPTLQNNLSNASVIWDVWVTGYGATQSNGIFESILGRIEIASVVSPNISAYASVTSAGTTSLASAQTFLCTWQWASASANNSIQILNAVLSAGTP